MTVKVKSDSTTDEGMSGDGLVQHLVNDDVLLDFAALSVDDPLVSSELTEEDIDLPFGWLNEPINLDSKTSEAGSGESASLPSAPTSGGPTSADSLDNGVFAEFEILPSNEATLTSSEFAANDFALPFEHLDKSVDSGNEISQVDVIGLATLPDTYTSGNQSVDDSLEYNVTINFGGDGWTDALKQDFISAGDYLSQIITDDITDIDLFGLPVDDIVISASLSEIDGVGGVVGQAGPMYIRTADSLPVASEMAFDSADAGFLDEIGLWGDVVLHEMLHAIGFGTIWDRLGLVDTYSSVEQTPEGPVVDEDYRFNGAAATEAFANEFPSLDDGLGPIVEDDGGPGTARGHWDEESFGDELMTGVIDSDGAYVSDMTIASLEDLGYETIYGDEIPIA